MIIDTPITGLELSEANPAEPIYVLAEFYQAFNNGDMALMSNNWEQTEAASMSNPVGGVKRGWGELEQVYERIFNGTAKVYVEFYDYTIHQTGEMFLAVGRERGYFQQGDTKIALAIRTSRTYRFAHGRWRQLHHHGSVDDPALLEQYQKAVLGKE